MYQLSSVCNWWWQAYNSVVAISKCGACKLNIIQPLHVSGVSISMATHTEYIKLYDYS